MTINANLPPAQLLVFAHSLAWTSAIEQRFTDYELAWAFSPEQLCALVQRSRATAAIVELSQTLAPATWHSLAELKNNPQRTLLFAVGEPCSGISYSQTRRLLQAVGFAAWYPSLTGFQQLVHAIKIRHHQQEPSTGSSGLTIEQAVQRKLPWKPIAGRESG